MMYGCKAGDVKPQRENYTPDYAIYHNVSRILSHLQTIANRFQKYVHLDLSFRSRLQRPQPVLRITNFTRMQEQEQLLKSHTARILLSYGEHSREFLPIESMFALLENVTGGLGPDASVSQIAYSSFVVNNIDLHIVAMLNPDGRVYIENSGWFLYLLFVISTRFTLRIFYG